MENKIIESIEIIDKSIKELDNKIKKLYEEKQTLDNSREIIYKINDICPVCSGKGETVDRMSMMRDNDMYSRSSDFKHTCSRCKGKGKYIEKGVNINENK